MDKKIKFSPDQLISATQLVRNFSKQLDNSLKQPLFIRRGQDIQWVLLNIKEYEQLLRKSK